MPRKGKLERAQPSPSRSPAAPNKYGRWRRAVEELLASRWTSSSLDLETIAATVVGMFDAGATDAEVEAFLRSKESPEREQPQLTDQARVALVRELHRSVGSEL